MEKRQRDRREDKIRRAFRRMFALLLAGAALGMVYCATGTDHTGAFLRVLGESPRLVGTLLRSELGALPDEKGLLSGMDGWQNAVLSESALLRAGESAVYDQLNANATPSAAPTESVTDNEGTETETAPPEATQQPQTSSSVKERTLLPLAQQNYAYADDVYIFNRTSQTINVAQLSAAKLSLKIGTKEPQVLIIHTHGSESYYKQASDHYTESDPSRTIDKNYNVVRVGDELTAVLKKQGIGVVHDQALYDYPSYAGSYNRSLKAVQAYLKQYPTISVILDIHRDALIGSDGTVYKAVTTIEKQKVAQVMLVIGSNDSGLNHPKWQENLKFAIQIQKQLNKDYPTLARPMSLRSSRYNQQVTVGSLLVEVGCNGNSLQEAIGGVRLFGNSLAEVLKGLE